MYYITTDLNDGHYYIAPLGKVSEPYLIRFAKRYQADDYLKKLIAGIKKDPLKDPKGYQFIETLTDPSFPGSVNIYEI